MDHDGGRGEEASESEPADGWYFDLPNGAWERQEAKNQELRQSVRRNIADDQSDDETRQDPFKAKKSGLFGLGGKKEEDGPRRESAGGTWAFGRADAAAKGQKGSAHAQAEPATAIEPARWLESPLRRHNDGDDYNERLATTGMGGFAWSEDDDAPVPAVPAETAVDASTAGAAGAHEPPALEPVAVFEGVDDSGADPPGEETNLLEGMRGWARGAQPSSFRERRTLASMAPAAEPAVRPGDDAPAEPPALHVAAEHEPASPGTWRREKPASDQPTKWDEAFANAPAEGGMLDSMKAWASAPPVTVEPEAPTEIPDEFLQPFEWEADGAPLPAFEVPAAAAEQPAAVDAALAAEHDGDDAPIAALAAAWDMDGEAEGASVADGRESVNQPAAAKKTGLFGKLFGRKKKDAPAAPGWSDLGPGEWVAADDLAPTDSDFAYLGSAAAAGLPAAIAGDTEGEWVDAPDDEPTAAVPEAAPAVAELAAEAAAMPSWMQAPEDEREDPWRARTFDDDADDIDWTPAPLSFAQATPAEEPTFVAPAEAEPVAAPGMWSAAVGATSPEPEAEAADAGPAPGPLPFVPTAVGEPGEPTFASAADEQPGDEPGAWEDAREYEPPLVFAPRASTGDAGLPPPPPPETAFSWEPEPNEPLDEEPWSGSSWGAEPVAEAPFAASSAAEDDGPELVAASVEPAAAGADGAAADDDPWAAFLAAASRQDPAESEGEAARPFGVAAAESPANGLSFAAAVTSSADADTPTGRGQVTNPPYHPDAAEPPSSLELESEWSSADFEAPEPPPAAPPVAGSTARRPVRREDDPWAAVAAASGFESDADSEFAVYRGHPSEAPEPAEPPVVPTDVSDDTWHTAGSHDWREGESDARAEDDIILKAFEAHAASGLDDRDQEPEDEDPDDADPFALEPLLGKDHAELIEEVSPEAEREPFGRLSGWAPQKAIGAEGGVPPWHGTVLPSAGAAPVNEGWGEFDDDGAIPPWTRPPADAAFDSEPPLANAKSGRRTVVREVVETLLLAILVFLSVRASFQNFKVDGSSMYPTLHDGQFLIVNKLVYSQVNVDKLSNFIPFIDPGDSPKRDVFHGPQRGDIIVLREPRDPSTDLIKRVIAKPGETIEIVDGKIYINDRYLEEPYIKVAWRFTMPKQLIPAGMYFVMGDNRDNSLDSRAAQIGLIPRDYIIGKAMLSYWPTSQFGLAPNASPRLGDEKPRLTAQVIGQP
ncbi:MAG: signal peptidase I [Chloroflexi bacterium]|nr:signal peptidase I [Chloroflexota bacterium]